MMQRSFVVFVVALVGALLLCSSRVNAVSDTDIAALRALYEATNGDQWAEKTNWLEGDPCSNHWFGITCSSGRIIELNLAGNNLVGTIPPEIGNLDVLILQLFQNSISGTFPPNFAALSDTLVQLWASGNQITGTLPQYFSTFSKLKHLDLSFNELTGQIPDLGLPDILSIYLGNNHFSGTIPAQLKDANDLAEIYFEYNEITGTIPAELGELGNLRWVDISHNQLEGTIPKELHGWSLLYDLNLSYNNLIGTLPKEFNYLDALQLFNVQSNQLIGFIQATFPTIPITNPDPVTLNFNLNYFFCPLPDWCQLASGENICQPCSEAGECDQPHDTPGCNSIPIQECVCNINSDCCTQQWYSACSKIATEQCSDLPPPPPPPQPTPTPTPTPPPPPPTDPTPTPTPTPTPPVTIHTIDAAPTTDAVIESVTVTLTAQSNGKNHLTEWLVPTIIGSVIFASIVVIIFVFVVLAIFIRRRRAAAQTLPPISDDDTEDPGL